MAGDLLHFDSIGCASLSTYLPAPFSKTQLVKVGFGRSVSHALVEGVAEAGHGTAEFVVGAEDMEKRLGPFWEVFLSLFLFI